MIPDELLVALEDAIVSACGEHERNHRWDKDYRRCLVVQEYFVKFDNYKSLCPQVETQKYVSQCAKLDGNAPRVPEVLHFFKRDSRMGYVVMDYIKPTPTPVQDLPQRVALALQWLRDLPAPLGHVGIGPLGNGRARHTLFKDREAPLSFSSIEAIERYLNKAITKLPNRGRHLAPVRISHERLVFTQSDMHMSNFGVDDKGKTCLFDFEEVGLLPESFVSYTMCSMAPFTVAVAHCLSWPPSSNLHSMGIISGCLWMLSNETLGLDENGYRKTA